MQIFELYSKLIFLKDLKLAAVLYKYNMVLREVVKITGPEVLDA